MDLTVILGIVGAVASISIGDLLDGGNPIHIIHIASLIIIFPTAMAAASEFLKQGLSMAIDGNEIDTIVEAMELVIEETEHYYHGCGHYWILAGETSPVMGLIGAVLGLILALKKLDDPPAMAMGIAGAFTATVTGIFSSYVLLGPFGRKMIAKSHHIVKEQKLLLEGIVGIASGDNPRALEAKLLNYLSPAEKKHSQFDK